MKNQLHIVENYYTFMIKKNFDAMAACLHPDVSIVGPLGETIGREAVVESAKKLSGILENIDIRAKFSSGNEVMLAYDWFFSEPIGKLKSAGFIQLKDHLIFKTELFFDSKPFHS